MTSSVTPRRATVLLFQGDDRERLEELLADIESTTAVAAATPSRIGDTDTDALAALQAYNAFVEEAKERAVKVVVQALGRRKWRDLRREHTTTSEDGEELDQEGFADVLVPASVVEPQFDTRAELEAFLDELNDADFSRLFTAAYAVNYTAGVVDPKAFSVSDLTQQNDET